MWSTWYHYDLGINPDPSQFFEPVDGVPPFLVSARYDGVADALRVGGMRDGQRYLEQVFNVRICDSGNESYDGTLKVWPVPVDSRARALTNAEWQSLRVAYQFLYRWAHVEHDLAVNVIEYHQAEQRGDDARNAYILQQYEQRQRLDRQYWQRYEQERRAAEGADNIAYANRPRSPPFPTRTSQ